MMLSSGLLRGAMLAVLGGCHEPVHTALWPEADELFHADPRWIGGDGAMTIDLGDERTLWVFGDSFIANTQERVRASSTMVRNSVAIQTGRDPSSAFMSFFWKGTVDEPRSFFAEEGETWFWPRDGVRLGDNVLLFQGRLRQTGEGMWGFSEEGAAAFLASHADDAPSNWVLTPVTMPAKDHGISLGDAVLESDDGWLYVYGRRDELHAMFLARFDHARAAEGDLSSPEWWCGTAGFSANGTPEALLLAGAPEFSVQYDARTGGYVELHSEGFGSTSLAIRTAPRPEGPWSSARAIVQPPESDEEDAFVYAGKAHAHLEGADLVATYVPSSFSERPFEDEARLYYPHFMRIWWGEQ